jgi:predicted RNA polymerase sigma factor
VNGLRGDAIDARQVAEHAARAAYGRLVAYLAARSRNVAAAEDALGDALLAALETWPRAGAPEKPEAWLLAVARRRLIDAGRHARVEALAAPTLEVLVEGAAREAEASTAFPDERLKLLFVCAHPALAESMRTPLMLQTVLGLDAARIASAFLVAPATMAQRLVRAKTKIRGAGIRFEIPDAREPPARLEAVAEAIYGAYGTGWDDIAGADPRRKGLAEEALSLERVLTKLLPDEPEAAACSRSCCTARHGGARDATPRVATFLSLARTSAAGRGR